MTREAEHGPVAGDGLADGFPPGLLLRLLTRILRWRLRGDQRRTPFFDATSGAPIAEPERVSAP